MANKIEKEMKEEKLMEWFVDKHRARVWKRVCMELKNKNKNMPWYKKMLYVNEHYQWKMIKMIKILTKEFNDALVSGGDE